MQHETRIVTRPPAAGSRHERARAICTCGWQGATYDAAADAEADGGQHVAREAGVSATWYDSPDTYDRRRALTLSDGRLTFVARQDPGDMWPPPVPLELPRDGRATVELAERLAAILEVPHRELRPLTQADLTGAARRDADAGHEADTPGGTMVTRLTPLNVRALAETYPDAIEAHVLNLTATTATWPGATPAEVLALLEYTVRHMSGRGHPRASLLAVLRKVKRQVPGQGRARARVAS